MESYFGRTVIHPVGLTALLLLGMLLLCLPRRLALLPVLLLACFVSVAQRIVVAGLDFDFFRILILFGWLRLIVRNELHGLRWNAVDTAVTAFVLIDAGVYSASRGTSDDLTNRLGWMHQSIGFYFLCRFLLTGAIDLRSIARLFAIVSIPVALCFAFEFVTHRNLFSVFGGVPSLTWLRDGQYRCGGPFAHPIVAGVFWAAILPWIASLWWLGGRWRTWAVLGSVSILFIVYATKSSTPVMSVAFGLVALAAYSIRRHLSAVRWGAAALLVALHLVMKRPVWHLLARLTVFDSSTGYHRFYVIDQCVRRFEDWWLAGAGTTAGWGVTDLTNQFVLVAVEGGLPALAAFVALIWVAFRRVGALVRASGDGSPRSRLDWSLGVSLFVHCMSFLALAYFGQANLIWYLTIATIATLETDARTRERAHGLPGLRRRRTSLRAVPAGHPGGGARPSRTGEPGPRRSE